VTDFISNITAVADEFEQHFAAHLPAVAGLQGKVIEAMRYTSLGGGKRLRPFFVVQTARMLGYDAPGVWAVASALECVHVYSLVHDDLPCMDDDDVRRGKPTVHKKWDEATAVLAGDALLTHAFDLLARETVHADPLVRLTLIRDLTKASGHDGMIGGQMIDLSMDSLPATEETITRLQDLKTGALIHYGVMAGATLAGADDAARKHLSAYAAHIGLIFQITDDLLDAEGDADTVGKAVQKDDDHGKATFVSILGIDGAKARARDLAEQAAGHLEPFGHKAAPLKSAIDFVLTRNK